MTNSTQPQIPTFTLGDGTPVPQVGFGTYPMRGEEGTAAMVGAIENGYRYIDSAVNYQNEAEVGEAVRRSGVAREELFIVSKVPGRFQGRESTVQCVRTSLQTMVLDQLDMYLIHWPNPSQQQYVDTWRGLIDAQQAGLVKHIGVCNFTEDYLADIIDATGVTPAVNQIELHPAFPQVEMHAEDERRGILTQAWSPIARATALADQEPVQAAARSHERTPSQVVLRWHTQRGIMPLPKSADAQRQRENLSIFDFELTADEMAAITALGRPDGRMKGSDPRTHEED